MSREDIIKEIRKLRNQKLSYQKIADNFNDRRIATLSGRGKWNKNSIIRLFNSSKVKQNNNQLFKELKQVKQNNIILQNKSNKINGNLIDAQNQKEKLVNELNKVKQINTKLIDDLNKLNEENSILHQKLNKVKQSELNESKNKVKMNINGWSVQKSGGYYRLFKKIDDKVHGIYLGKTINENKAKNKILHYLQKL